MGICNGSDSCSKIKKNNNEGFFFILHLKLKVSYPNPTRVLRERPLRHGTRAFLWGSYFLAATQTENRQTKPGDKQRRRLKIEDAKSSFPRFHAKLTDDFLLKARSIVHFRVWLGGLWEGLYGTRYDY